MKRNVVPLLAIAFVVAAISTGVFYGIFAGRLRGASIDLPQRTLVVAARDLERGAVLKPEDLKVTEIRLQTPFKGSFDSPIKLAGAVVLEPIQQNEPVTEREVVLKDGSAGNGVPRDMRAVSIHVYESSGILGLIGRGSKVDIQAVTERNHMVQLSTVLQDIEVLWVNPLPDASPGTNPKTPVVTVLVHPMDSDIVALADSGTHLRLALRNPLDDRTEPRQALGVPVLYRGTDTGERGNTPIGQLHASGATGSGQER
jgi:pilus assembly protein CpaB